MNMKKITLGIIAHVDSGKTTLCEAILYNSGRIKNIGRVDHKNAYLDNFEIERERGITVFSKQAEISLENTSVTIHDTPGHVDFSAEAERTLRVLDYAVLVISGTDGVQSHTETMWKMLEHYNIPTFIFINKTDIMISDIKSVIDDIKTKLSEACIDFSKRNDEFFESCAVCDSDILEEYTEYGTVSESSVISAIRSRNIFPCFMGSALKNTGVLEFMSAVNKLTTEPPYKSKFGAKVYKISEDERGNRLTFMKITGGSLKVKTNIEHRGRNEKVNEIRIYTGNKYDFAGEVFAGDVCAVTGISSALPGDGLGVEEASENLLSEPVFTYSVKLPEGADISACYNIFKRLENEETQMHTTFDEHVQKISVSIMGEIQLEILKRILLDRFDLSVEFENGNIIYKETISDTFEGVGHYEPLRHYSEVHLLLEPGERGSGLVFTSACSETELDRNWQRLVLTHLEEKTHIGVLTGSPVTDMKISLVSGKAHLKHTEGGDFRQSTYRAVRQGLMQARARGKCVLLEPWYEFKLEIPTLNVGRAMTDLGLMNADYSLTDSTGDFSVIKGKAPVSKIRDYGKEVISYSHGVGKISMSFDSYAPCTDTDAVVKNLGYEPESDLMNTADSVFCSHGAGFLVKWDEVYNYMHLPKLEDKKEEVLEPIKKPVRRDYSSMIADEEEILRIFEATYGKIKRRTPEPLKTVKEARPEKKIKPVAPLGPTYLLVDGYNIIFADDELKRISEESLDLARALLIDKICNYQAYRQNNVILVFDAYKVKGSVREIEKIHGISVVYTKEAETADQYIEKTSKELSKNYRVRVATSDSQIQMIIFGSGAVRVTAREFMMEVNATIEEMREFIEMNNS